MDPLISVVIPTHNRFKYARYAIQSILSMDDSKLELVVHDTSTDTSLKEWVLENTNDSRLSYYHVEEALSMTENHNRAVDIAKGEYICIIGDDDSVTEEIVDAASWAKRNDVDALTPKMIATYSWPDFRTKFFGDAHAGKMYIAKFTGKFSRAAPKKALRLCLNSGGQGTGTLPKVYHGIVKKSVLEKVKGHTGQYFWGVSPDMSGAIGISRFLEKAFWIDYPITVPGASGGSNTGRSALNNHKGSLDDDPHMVRFKDEYWPLEVPRFFSVETVWAQAAYSTTLKLDDKSLLNSFNVAMLHAVCWNNHQDYAGLIKKNYSNYLSRENKGYVKGWVLFWRYVLKGRTDRVRYLIGRLVKPSASGGKTVLPDNETIAEAMVEFQKVQDISRSHFSKIVADASL